MSTHPKSSSSQPRSSQAHPPQKRPPQAHPPSNRTAQTRVPQTQPSQTRPAPRPVPPKAKSRNNRLGWVWIGLGLAGVAMLSATAGALLAVSLSTTPLMQRRMSPEEASVFSQNTKIATTNVSLRLPELTRPVNILVLGLKVLTSDVNNPPTDLKNQRYHALVNSFEGLSDTMLLLRFNPETKKLTMMSIPRDTRTYIAGYGMSKINAANAYGGPALSARTVSELLGGVSIDRYVGINVQGVQALVDALGGVTVNVPKDMKYQDDSQHLYINLKAGKRRLNGDQALQLIRFRYDENGDIGRIQRQQMVMRALMEQALTPATVGRMPQILSVVKSYIDTNLSVEELLALVGFASQMQRSDTQMLMVPGTFSVAGEYDASYWLPNPDRIRTMMSQHFDMGLDKPLTSEPSSLRVAIQDSLQQPTAAQSLVKTLGNSGYSNVYLDDPWNEPLNETRIIAQQGNVEDAEMIRRSLGFGEVRVESTGSIRSDITIQIGRDWLKLNGAKLPSRTATTTASPGR